MIGQTPLSVEAARTELATLKIDIARQVAATAYLGEVEAKAYADPTSGHGDEIDFSRASAEIEGDDAATDELFRRTDMRRVLKSAVEQVLAPMYARQHALELYLQSSSI